MLPSIRELIASQQLEVGKVARFRYLPKTEKSPAEQEKGVAVELPEVDWMETGARIAAIYPKRYARNAAVADRLGHHWASLAKSKAIKAEIEARKKALGVRLWEDYWAGNPEDKTHWDTAEATLADSKKEVEEVTKAFTSEEKTEEGDPRVKHFFRYFDLENEGGEGAYEVEAIFLGETLDTRNGNRRALWLVRKSTVSNAIHERDFKK